jgi:uncharacterized repeat protein (TIGR03803 family)
LTLVSGTWQEVVLYSFSGGLDGSSPVASLLADSAGNFYTTTFSSGDAACGNSPGCGTLVKLIASSGKVSVLYDFPSELDGKNPSAALVADNSGSLYGTTTLTGYSSQPCMPGCYGAVYKLTESSNGQWAGEILYTFPAYKGDGEFPHSSVVFDSNGNLYGTTESGGTSSYSCGTVFELSPSVDGMWTEQILYNFRGGAQDGCEPMGRVLFDGSHRIYGTTVGGDNGASTVFQLAQQDGAWRETIVYNFEGDAVGPSVVTDEAGDLYGTISYQNGLYGGVFELSRNGSSWSETALYTFSGTDGDEYFPGELIFGKDGSLYGAAYRGGLYDAGVVFKLTPGSNGTWTETVLHNFAGVDGDGANPMGKLIFDDLGNLYGTTSIGGINGGQCGGFGCGIAYELSPSVDGKWKETVLHRFTGGLDGGSPLAGMLFDSSDDLLGTTNGGGFGQQGTVFAIKH